MNVVDFSLLSDALAPLTVPDLLSTVVVASNPEASSGRGLPDVVRRYQDLVLAGHPGAGKTTAVRQLAANFASGDDAPLPIVVKLSRIRAAVGDPNDVTLELLVTDAVAHVPEQHRTVMADIARRELTSGFALLICDGLDECGTRASAVVDGLVRLKQQFGQDVGVLLTTRASALRSALKVGCQVMHLLAPARAHEVQAQAVRAAMEQLDLTAGERVRREQRLKRIQDEQPAITSVPLLGNLVAVLVGLGRESNLDGSVADLLEQVIKEALSRWEANRGLDGRVRLRRRSNHICCGTDTSSSGTSSPKTAARRGARRHHGWRRSCVNPGARPNARPRRSPTRSSTSGTRPSRCSSRTATASSPRAAGCLPTSPTPCG